MIEAERQYSTYQRISSWAEVEGFATRKGGAFYKHLGEALLRAAKEHGEAKQLPSDNFENLTEECLETVEQLRMGLEAWEEETDAFKGWRHQGNPVAVIRAGTIPQLDKATLEAAVGRYLALPIRATTMDRTLVDLMMGMEIYAFGAEVRPAILSVTASGWLKNRIYSAALLFGLWLVTAFFGADWGVWFVLFFGAETAWTIFATTRKPKAVTILKAALQPYYALQSSGPISGRHVADKVREAENAGVVWPAPLHVLLDDINERGGRF